MVPIILVAIGGAVGVTARFLLSEWVAQLHGSTHVPWPTLVVNVLGCLVAGCLIGLGGRYGFLTSELRLLLFAGLLGGFTTFSAFGIETVMLLKQGAWETAVAYVASSVILGCGGVALGMWWMSE